MPQERILEHCWYIGDAAAKTDVEKVCHVNSFLHIVSDMLRKLECFRHVVVEPYCRGVSAQGAGFALSRALWRGARSSLQL